MGLRYNPGEGKTRQIRSRYLQFFRYQFIHPVDEHVLYLPDFVRELYFLGNCQVTEKGLDRIEKLKNLEILHLPCCKFVNGDYLKRLSTTNLKSLSLSCCKITDDCLECLKLFPKLTRLDISFCFDATDAGLVHLQRFEFVELNVTGCGIADKGLKLLKLSNLMRLGISCCRYVTMGPVSRLTQLTTLEISSSGYVTGKQFLI